MYIKKDVKLRNLFFTKILRGKRLTNACQCYVLKTPRFQGRLIK